MREEYTRDNYPSFGKKYAGEKAIISLTSWKARINTVSKTLYSLLKQCPGFHIVLVLSEEEFPKMMDEMPQSLKLFVKNNLIEVLWVYKNYKAFKKVLFAMDKYSYVPVISADDDCIYTCNYAQTLYREWENDKSKIVCYRKSSKNGICGPSSLYPPSTFSTLILEFKKLDVENLPKYDDTEIYNWMKMHQIQSTYICEKFPCFFHDELEPLSGGIKKNKLWEKSQSFS